MTTNEPQPQEDLDGDGRWMSIHTRFKSEVTSNEPEVIFFGDSHIALLEQSDFYQQVFAPLHCLCFGIRGDTTGNVHWRILNGELEDAKPKIIVLLVGTNNRGQPAEQILDGIKEIVELVSSKQPQATILTLKIPPRGQHPNPKRKLLVEINSQLAGTLKHIPNCHILDIDPGFVSLADGTINHRDMYDYLHFTNQGYRKAFEIVHSTILSLLYPEMANSAEV